MNLDRSHFEVAASVRTHNLDSFFNEGKRSRVLGNKRMVGGIP